MLELWYSARDSAYGIEVEVDGDRESARQKLYAARREARDDTLSSLALCLSPTRPNCIWIVRKP